MNRSILQHAAAHHPGIDPAACIHPDAEVGPGCIIRGDVRIDAGTRLIANAYLQGPLRIGRDNTLYPGVCLGLAPQDHKFDPDTAGPGVVIGDRNILREGVTIHRATGERPTTVGSDNYLMVNSHLGHDVTLGDRCTLVNGALIGGHVQVQDQALVSGNAAVHQFCRVGRLAVLSGVMFITQDLPPFCVCYRSRTVSSLNLVGLRRAGLREHIRPLGRAFAILYRSGLPNPAAADRIDREFADDPLCRELAAFVRASRRGICPYVPASSRTPDTTSSTCCGARPTKPAGFSAA